MLPGKAQRPLGRMVHVNSRSAWLTYSLLRIAFFAVPFGVLYAIGWAWWLALLVATLVAAPRPRSRSRLALGPVANLTVQPVQ